MKKAIIILVSIFFCFVLSAQTPAPGSYLPNNTMTAFHGTWMWTSGTDTVKIYLTTKKIYNEPENFYTDYLIGWHLYKKGNTIVESSFGNINIVGTQTIFLWNNYIPDNPKVNGGLTDLSKASKQNNLCLTINSAQNQITWKCTEPQGRIYPESMTIPPAGVTLPGNIVLTKL